MREERETMEWVHQEISNGARIPMVEADAVVRSLSIAMHAEQAMVAYEHHVMIDGGGYPPLPDARGAQYASMLVHVCDVYDALRTNRPYREAWESEKALAYIRDRAGVEFDPGIAQAFIAMMRRWDQRIAKLA